MFAEDDSIILRPNGIQEMTTCTSRLPPLVHHSATLHIYAQRVYKYTALLWPNVCLVGAQKVALPQQLEEIGGICSLHRSADISSRLSDLGDVCWEIKQALRKAEVTMLCWNWPEVCPGPGAVDPTFLLRLHALSTQSWLKACLWNLSTISIIVTQKPWLKESDIKMCCDRRREGQSCIWQLNNCKCVFNNMCDDWWYFSISFTE